MTENASSSVPYRVAGMAPAGDDWKTFRDSRRELWTSAMLSRASDCLGGQKCYAKRYPKANTLRRGNLWESPSMRADLQRYKVYQGEISFH